MPGERRRSRGLLVAAGALALLVQVVLLRELLVAGRGSELLCVSALSGWLVAGALGSLLLRRAPPGGLLAAASLLLPASLVLLRGLRGLLGVVPGAQLPLSALAVAGMVPAPAAALLGALFPRLAARLAAAGGGPASAYALECTGAAGAGVLATLALAARLSNLDVALLTAAACAAAAAGASPRGRACWVLCGTWLLALPASARIDLALVRLEHPDAVALRDTPYARVVVEARAGQVVLFENDALAAESQGTAAEELLHLAALHHPAPRRLLLLGGSAEGLVGEALRQHPASVDVVEVDRGLLALQRPFLEPAPRAALEDPRVRLVFDDPRRVVAREGSWDVILVAEPGPESGRANRVYTADFFRDCARRLAPRGVLALRLKGAENAWPPALLLRTASVVGALRAAFADVVVLPGDTLHLLASAAPLPRDPEVLVERLLARGIEARLVRPAWLRWRYGDDRGPELLALLRAAPAAVNTDARPACYLYSLLAGLARLSPSLQALDPGPLTASRTPLGVVAAGLLGLVLVARRQPRAARPACVALASAAGMLLQTALLLHEQSRRGALFGDLGLLLGASMAGLATGAALAAARPLRGSAAALLAVALGTGLALPASPGLTVSLVLLFASGAALAAVVAGCLAAAEDHEVARLWAADLLGGALGALAAGLLLVPLQGLAGTAFAAAACAAAAALARPGLSRK
jgi:spermidine synthase